MSKTSKIPHNYLLIKVNSEGVKYRTPCNKYEIEYTNNGFFDDIHWIASIRGINLHYANTLSDLLEKIVNKNPYMDTDLYKILYGIEEDE